MNNQKSRKVAFVASVYRHLEAFHLPFMQLLQKKGYEVHAYACPDHGKSKVEENNVICHEISFARSPFSFRNVHVFRELCKSFQEKQFDMIHVHTPVASILGRMAAKRAKVPFVVYTAHGLHFFQGAPWMNWLLYYPVEWWMAHYTDVLITINQEDFTRVQNFPVRKRVSYVPGVGLQLEQFQSVEKYVIRKNVRNALDIGGEDFVVVCIGELNENKNQKQLIRAIHKMKEKQLPIRCLLVGTGGKERELKELVSSLGLESRIHFLGFRRDICDLLEASDVCAHVSKREGLPRAIMEAMAAGKPIVTNNIRGCRDLVRHEQNGYVVPVADVESTAQALTKLCLDPLLRNRMGAKSLEFVKKYDLTSILSEMESIYLSHEGGDLHTPKSHAHSNHPRCLP